MIAHVLMDIHSGHLGYVAFRSEDEAFARAASEPFESGDALGVDGAAMPHDLTTERDRAPSA